MDTRHPPTDSGYFDAPGGGSPDIPRQAAPRRKTNSAKIKWVPEQACGGPHPPPPAPRKRGGRAAPGPRRRPHLPGEAAAGFRRREGTARLRPRGVPPLPRPCGGGRNPEPEVSARRRQARQGPSSGAARAPQDQSTLSATRSRLPSRPRGASPRRAPRRPHLPGAPPQPGERLHPPGASAAPPARPGAPPRPSAPAAPVQADAGRPRSAPAAAGFVARPPTANLLRSLSRPLRLRSAASAPQQHGGRGLRRKPGGGEVGDGPGRCRPARALPGTELPTRANPKWARARLPEHRGPGPRRPGPRAPLSPRGGPEAPARQPVTELRRPTRLLLPEVTCGGWVVRFLPPRAPRLWKGPSPRHVPGALPAGRRAEPPGARRCVR